jgi:hypothetical protein
MPHATKAAISPEEWRKAEGNPLERRWRVAHAFLGRGRMGVDRGPTTRGTVGGGAATAAVRGRRRPHGPALPIPSARDRWGARARAAAAAAADDDDDNASPAAAVVAAACVGRPAHRHALAHAVHHLLAAQAQGGHLHEPRRERPWGRCGGFWVVEGIRLWRDLMARVWVVRVDGSWRVNR